MGFNYSLQLKAVKWLKENTMKKLKLKFVGFYPKMNPKDTFLWKILEKHYEIFIDENPDYIICGCFDYTVQYVQYPQVRIFYCGENFVPDFNLVDYAICSYPISFLDRSMYMPQFIEGYEGDKKDFFLKNKNYNLEWLNKKTRFANFIASHESEHGIRGDFMKKLSEYKRVDSPGKYLYNMEDGEIVDWKNDSKTDFQRTCKFSLCFESTSNGGFCTEKLTDAFYAETIPVYYGDPYVGDVFNTKAFINCADYENFDQVIEKIKEIDQNNDLYLEMINQPIFKDKYFIDKKLKEYEEFVCNIFDQSTKKAYRRSRVYHPCFFEQFLQTCGPLYEKIKLFDKVSLPIRKVSLPVRKIIADLRGRNK